MAAAIPGVGGLDRAGICPLFVAQWADPLSPRERAGVRASDPRSIQSRTQRIQEISRIVW